MDDVGVELADITQARTEALEQCRKLLTKRPGDFWTGEEWRIDVYVVLGMSFVSR